MHKPDGKTHFSTWEEALERVEEFADALDCNVSITLEDGGTYRFWGHGPRIATWMCGDKEDDLAFYGITRKPNPKKGYLKMVEK